MNTSNRIAAETAIRELAERYCDAVNRRDGDAWGATWSTHAAWTLGETTTVGRDAIVERWLTLMARVPLVVQELSFGMVDGPTHDGATAGRWYITEFTQRPQGAARVCGLYRDRYVIEEGSWRFAARDFEILHAERNLAPDKLPGADRDR